GLQLFSRQIPVLFLDRLELVYDHGLAISALEFTISCRNITALPSQRQLLPQRHQSEILLLGEAHLIRMGRLLRVPTVPIVPSQAMTHDAQPTPSRGACEGVEYAGKSEAAHTPTGTPGVWAHDVGFQPPGDTALTARRGTAFPPWAQALADQFSVDGLSPPA